MKKRGKKVVINNKTKTTMSGRLAKILRGTELDIEKFEFTDMKTYQNGKTALVNYDGIRGRVGIQTPLLKSKGLLVWKQKMDNSLSFELVVVLKEDDKFTRLLHDMDDRCKTEAKKDPKGWLGTKEYSDAVFEIKYKKLVKESVNKETGEAYPSTFTVKLLTDENLVKFVTDKKNERAVSFLDKETEGTISVDLQDFVNNTVNKSNRDPKDNKPFIMDSVCGRDSEVSAVFYFSHVNNGQTGVSIQRRLYCARINNKNHAKDEAEMLPDETDNNNSKEVLVEESDEEESVVDEKEDEKEESEDEKEEEEEVVEPTPTPTLAPKRTRKVNVKAF
jgi:hypothetical protein